MVELSLMASSAFSHAFFQQDPPQSQQLGLCRRPPPREFRSLLPGHITRQEILRSGSLQLKSNELEDPWKSQSLLSECYPSAKPVSAINKPVLIDVQDARPDSVLFSFGIAEQCTRHEKILQFLMSGSNISVEEGLNISLLSDLTGLHTLAINMHPQLHVPMDAEFCLYEIGNNDLRPSLVYPQTKFYSPKPVLGFVADSSRSSMIMAHPDGRVLFTGTETEIKDLLSIVAEFYLSNNSSRSSKQQMVVPYFTRFGTGARANTYRSSIKLHTETVASLKSPEKIKLKPPLKKKQNRKAGRERDLYGKNYFHACESLLSMILYKNRGKMAIMSVKKSGPELSHLLTQFSAGIAGTGLAVLFAVILKISSGRAPFCTTKLLNTGFAFGLVWLSWAVNTLRDNILCISKNSSKTKWKEEEIAFKVERSVNEIFFRAATLMAMAVLRFA